MAMAEVNLDKTPGPSEGGTPNEPTPTPTSKVLHLTCECGATFEFVQKDARGAQKKFCDRCHRRRAVAAVARHRQRASRNKYAGVAQSHVEPGLAIRSIEEVAQILKVTHSTIVRTEARALGKLRKHPLFKKVWKEKSEA
jgi:hypothetical protein